MATSGATFGESPAPETDRLWNDKGAWRMMVGLRVLRGGLAAALMMVALPVVAVATVSLASSQAVAQTAASIGVEGNRRMDLPDIRRGELLVRGERPHADGSGVEHRLGVDEVREPLLLRQRREPRVGHDARSLTCSRAASP